MTKMQWDRAKPGHESYDEQVARDWRKNAEDFPSDGRPDSAKSVNFLAVPDIYWSTDLARMYPVENYDTHRNLYNRAKKAAQSIYKSHGINVLMTRSEKFHERSSSKNRFPSDYFAIYFELVARQIALNPKARHDPPPRRKLAAFFTPWPKGFIESLPAFQKKP